MDPNAARFQNYDRRVEIWWDGDARYYRGTVKNYYRSTNKYGILYDDDSWEIVDLHHVAHRWLKPEAPPLPAPPEPGSKGYTTYLQEVQNLVVETIKQVQPHRPTVQPTDPSLLQYDEDILRAHPHFDRMIQTEDHYEEAPNHSKPKRPSNQVLPSTDR